MSRLLVALITGVLTGLLGLISGLAPFGLEMEEALGLDLLFKLRGIREVPSDVVIVAVDKASADNMNLPVEPEKWPRSQHARLIEKLVEKGAAAIAFDIIFDDPHSRKNDKAFARAIRTAGNVVLAERLIKETVPLNSHQGKRQATANIEKLITPIDPLARAAVGLAPFPLPKVPVKVNQYWTFKTGAGDTPTLPVVVLQVFALQWYGEFVGLWDKVCPSPAEKLPEDRDAIMTGGRVENHVRLLREILMEQPWLAKKMLKEMQNSETQAAHEKAKQILTAITKAYSGPASRYLNYYGPPGTIRTVPYHQVGQNQEKSTVDQHQLDFNGKAVFVGLSERSRLQTQDGFYTVFSQENGIDLSGVEIAATAFANLLEDTPVRPLGLLAHAALFLLWGMLLGILCMRASTVIATGSVIGLSAAYLTLSCYQFGHNGLWFPLVVPLFFQVPLATLGSLWCKYILLEEDRDKIRKAFGYFLPDQVVDQLLTSMPDMRSTGQTVYAICMCTDIEKYTTIADRLDPEDVSNLMNDYFEAVFEPVRQHGGIVSDIKGDSMLAIWVSAQPDAVFRKQACLAALEVAQAVDRFNQSAANRFHTSPEPLQLPTRIGLAAGEISLGTIGAIDHYEYRPVGSPVNTSARIEGLNKQLGTRLLVSEEVLHQCDGFLSRRLGNFLLVGKTKTTVVYELICRQEDSNDQQRSLCARFTHALGAYDKQCWEEAIVRFKGLITSYKDEGPSLFYASLCERCRQNSPGQEWNGVVPQYSK